MNTGYLSDFWSLYSKEGVRGIKISQIQRDYVQGRGSDDVKINRKKFVEDLVDSLVNNKKINLNFIYGYYEDNYFYLIDGQQRLTTLFLLHLFVFARAGENIMRDNALKFFYETRFTNERFFEKLKNFDFNARPSEKLSQVILNCPWYAGTWTDNPTIFSCLVMIDEIQSAINDLEKTKGEKIDFKNLSKTLINESPIQFMILEIERWRLGKPNELYIKMNSRGRQLTDFENFKATLYSWMKNEEKTARNEDKNLYQSIRKNIDVDWFEMIWNTMKDGEEKAEKFADIFFRDLIHWVFINRIAVGYQENIKNKRDLVNFDEKLIKSFKPSDENIKDVYLDNYLKWCEELNIDFNVCLYDLKATLTILNTIYKNHQQYWEYLSALLLQYVAKNKYSNILSSYKKRVMLFAVTKYGEKEVEFDIKNFKQWFRIIRNLIDNSQIDNTSTFVNACAEINNFDYSSGIAVYIKNTDLLTFRNNFLSFRKEIDEEEFLKQQIINKTPVWEDVILDAEKNSEFNAEIGFVFRLSDIQNADDADGKLDQFKIVWQKVLQVFEFAKNEKEQLFHRLLLTYGDYSEEDKKGIKCFYRYTEPHHNKDWRGMLRSNGNGFKCFSKLIADLLKEEISIETLAQKRVNGKNSSTWDKLIPGGIDEDLRYYLITMKEMFDYCKEYYYIWHDTEKGYNRYVLMKNSVLKCYVEAKIYALSILLDCKYTEGATRYDNDRRRSYIEYNKKKIEFNGNYFICDLVKEGEITSIKEMYDLLKQNKTK